MNLVPPVSSQQHHPSLQTLAAEFKRWRAERSSRRTPVPTTLRRKAVELLAICRRSHIITALGINNSMLKNWQHSHEKAPAQSAFVPLNFSAESTVMHSAPAELVLSNRTGQQVTLRGKFSATQLAWVARALSDSTEEFAP